jgi:hypothetical protein
MTKDKKLGRPAKDVIWTNKAPPAARKAPPVDILNTGEELSRQAKAAKTLAELWDLFFTPSMQEKMVRYTNDKIQETIVKKKEAKADFRKLPYVKLVDLVRMYNV